MPTSNYTGRQQRNFNGGQYRGNNLFKPNYRGINTNTHKNNNGWSGNTDSRSAPQHECQICQRRGHTTPNCYHINSNAAYISHIIECRICGKHGHIALDCFHRSNYSYQAPAPPTSLNPAPVPFNVNFSYQVPSQMYQMPFPAPENQYQ